MLKNYWTDTELERTYHFDTDNGISIEESIFADCTEYYLLLNSSQRGLRIEVRTLSQMEVVTS